MPTYDWRPVWKAPGGRRYFEDRATGRLAAADESGPTPDTTEDGVLWLIRGARIHCSWDAHGGNHFDTTVEREDGETTATMGLDVAEALWLADELRSYIHTGGRDYSIRRVRPS